MTDGTGTDGSGTDGSGTDGRGNGGPGHSADIYQFTPPPPSPDEIAGAAALRMARRRRRLKRTAAGLAVVIGGSTGTAVAALASGAAGQAPRLTAATAPSTTATSGASNTQPSTTQPGTSQPGNAPGPFGRRGAWGMPRFVGPPGPVAMGGDVLHGTYTLETSTGRYETVQVQTGTASAVSSSSIEVKSADGYVQSYTVSSSTLVDANSNGITAIANGDKVLVQATISGNSATAQRVTDLTQVGSERARWPGGPGSGGPGSGGPGSGGPGSGGPGSFDGGPAPAA